MDLRVFTTEKDKDIYRYAPPDSYELHGKELIVTYDGGERETLFFRTIQETANPTLIGGDNHEAEGSGTARSHRCVKIADAVWLAVAAPPLPPAAYVLDLGAGLITRASRTAESDFVLSFGAREGAPESTQKHELTGDLNDNTVEWTFGISKPSVISVSFESGTAELTRPYAPEAPKLSVGGFHAVKITDTIFLQTASVTCEKTIKSVCLLSDFRHVLCVGCIFDPEGAVRIIGGHGKYIH